MKLYDYYRSTACYRVRIALNLKNLNYETVPVHLVKHGGEQHTSQYKQINPQCLVPSLDINGHILTQSLAIIDYLDEVYPNPPLLPANSLDRAIIRSLALIVACDVHPLNNLRVLKRLKEQFKSDEEQVSSWYHHWLKSGFDAFESKLHHLQHSESFCFGNTVSLADICLIPQVYNANRFKFAMDNYPLINNINTHCLSLEPFQKAIPKENET